MNYKIKITEENQAIVKRIADENGMNLCNFTFRPDCASYEIIEGKFVYNGTILNSEFRFLTTEKFIEIFDKKQSELEVWLMETKARNLSLKELIKYVCYNETCSFSNVYRSLIGNTPYEKARILYDQWNTQEQTEWKPIRGERVLVWDNDESDTAERIFLAEIEGAAVPIIVVRYGGEFDFSNNQTFHTIGYKHMKQIPTPKAIVETDFKTKVVKLLKVLIDESKDKMEAAIQAKSYHDVSAWKIANQERGQLLTKIKELN